MLDWPELKGMGFMIRLRKHDRKMLKVAAGLGSGLLIMLGLVGMNMRSGVRMDGDSGVRHKAVPILRQDFHRDGDRDFSFVEAEYQRTDGSTNVLTSDESSGGAGPRMPNCKRRTSANRYQTTSDFSSDDSGNTPQSAYRNPRRWEWWDSECCLCGPAPRHAADRGVKHKVAPWWWSGNFLDAEQLCSGLQAITVGESRRVHDLFGGGLDRQ